MHITVLALLLASLLPGLALAAEKNAWRNDRVEFRGERDCEDGTCF